VIELDMTQIDGNEYFKLDNCIDCLTIDATFIGNFNSTSNIVRTIGYDTY